MIDQIFSPDFLAVLAGIAVIVLAATQVVKKAIEGIIKKATAPWVGVAVSFVASTIVCFPRITSEGIWMYLIYVVFGWLTANGWFKVIPKTVTPSA